MKIESITISRLELELIDQALAELEQSYRDFSDEHPDGCNEYDLEMNIRRVRKTSELISIISENSPLMVEVSK